MTKSSPWIWQFLRNVKLTLKILSNFVAFLEKINFIQVESMLQLYDIHQACSYTTKAIAYAVCRENWTSGVTQVALKNNGNTGYRVSGLEYKIEMLIFFFQIFNFSKQFLISCENIPVICFIEDFRKDQVSVIGRSLNKDALDLETCKENSR